MSGLSQEESWQSPSPSRAPATPLAPEESAMITRISHEPARSGPAIPTSTGIVVHKALLSFLKENCSIRISGRSMSEVARLQALLNGYWLSMSCPNVVDGIVASSGHRKLLLELSSQIGLANDPRLRSALRADEERIAALIVSILDSKSAQDAALKLEGDRAQSIVDAIQEALNRGYLMAQDRRRAHRILRKLSESSDRLPSSLFLSGVTDREEQPTFVGDFADIYRASYGSKTVALKHMRQFTQSSELHDVRLKLIDWKNLHHPYILPFMGIDRESIPASLCIVSPWMENGMILDHLNAHGRSNVDKFLSEIAQGLQYLHSCDIVHGDLRGANILINEDFSACLANFGLGVFTSTHTSTRAGSLYWMAPELIDRIVPTSASDVYAFGCVCFELYTGHPPFFELSEASALIRVVNGERPTRPSTSPLVSSVLWQHVTAYWAQDPAKRPPIDIVVQEMAWPSPGRSRNTSRPLPSIPLKRSRPLPIPVAPSTPPAPVMRSPLPPIPVVPRRRIPLPPIPAPPRPASPSESSVSSSSSLPVYRTPQGSPPGYNPAEYQRVEVSPSKMAQMGKASEGSSSRELDLAHIMELVDKASERSLRDQTVVLSGGMNTLLERARQRDLAKRQAVGEQRTDDSNARRPYIQDAALEHTRKNPNSMLSLPEFIREAMPRPADPEEILAFPQFVKEVRPLCVLDDLFVAAAPLRAEKKSRPTRRRPSLPWLRISPSLSTRRYQLSNPKSSPPIPESATPVVDPKSRSGSGLALGKYDTQSGLDNDKTPVRERVKDVLAASGSKTDTALRGLWRRVKASTPQSQGVADDSWSNSSFSIGRLSEREDESSDDEDVDASPDKTPPAGLANSRPPPDGRKLGRSPPPAIVPPDEDMWRLFECKIAAEDATQLSELLAMTPSQDLQASAITELYKKCMESQEAIFSQIPWASAGAEHSREMQHRESTMGDETLAAPAFTWEEGLLLEMLATNEALIGAIRLYDELSLAAQDREKKRQDPPGGGLPQTHARPRNQPPISKRRPLVSTAHPPGRPPQESLPVIPTVQAQ